MKKIIGIACALALGAAAFAEITISSWSRYAFAPVMLNDDDLVAAQGTNWNAPSNFGKVGVSLVGNSEDCGFELDIAATTEGKEINDNFPVTVSDNALVWVKPLSFLRLKLGKIDNNWGRQDFCFGVFDHSLRFTITEGEGLATYGNGVTGCEATLTFGNLSIDGNIGVKSGEKLYKTYAYNSNILLVYETEALGRIRLQAVGKESFRNNKDDNVDYCMIQAAYDKQLNENVYMTLGASVPTALQYAGLTKKILEDAGVTKDVNIDVPTFGLGMKFNSGDLTLNLLGKAKINPKEFDDEAKGTTKLGEFGINAGLGVDYALNDTYTLITDFRLQNNKYSSKGYSTVDKEVEYHGSAWGAYIGIAQKLSNATFDFGVQVGKDSIKGTTDRDDVAFAIPLNVTVAF